MCYCDGSPTDLKPALYISREVVAVIYSAAEHCLTDQPRPCKKAKVGASGEHQTQSRCYHRGFLAQHSSKATKRDVTDPLQSMLFLEVASHSYNFHQLKTTGMSLMRRVMVSKAPEPLSQEHCWNETSKYGSL